MCWAFKKLWYRTCQKVLKLGMCFMNWAEPELLKGEDAVLKLPSFIKDKNINRVLVVTDKGLMGLHLLDPMFKELENVGIEYFVFDGVQPNPTINNIEDCKNVYLNTGIEFLQNLRRFLADVEFPKVITFFKRAEEIQFIAIFRQNSTRKLRRHRSQSDNTLIESI